MAVCIQAVRDQVPGFIKIHRINLMNPIRTTRCLAMTMFLVMTSVLSMVMLTIVILTLGTWSGTACMV